jgi:PilZ domain-containing protein
MGMNVTVQVRGHDQDGTAWEEMTASDDISYGGASFPLRHSHGVGQVLLLSAPLPSSFRRYDEQETSYKSYALIRNSRSNDHGARVVGVMFLGRVPPKGFEARPGGRYRLPSDPRAAHAPAEPQAPPGERRRNERLQLFVDLRLRRTGVSGSTEEQTVTENLSRGGARVFTTLQVARGETLTVCDLDGRVAVDAVVRNVYVGPDRVTRLNLQFPDLRAFERLLQAAGTPPLPPDAPA